MINEAQLPNLVKLQAPCQLAKAPFSLFNHAWRGAFFQHLQQPHHTHRLGRKSHRRRYHHAFGRKRAKPQNPLFGIDAPETNTNQPFGEEARAFLAQEIEGKKVQIIIKTKSDKYGRVVGVVKFDGQDINKIMVQKGYAWAYSYYTDAYTAEHNAARAQQIGLWADDNSTNKPIEPYKWRKTHQKKGF